MTSPADTLVYDTAGIAVCQVDPAYDYNRELIAPEADILGLINLWLAKLLRQLFGNHFAERYTGVVLIFLVIAILMLLIWFLYKKHPALFLRSRRNKMIYNVQEDTIYGVDFPLEIRTACARNEYREAIRLLYLQTLKQLSDAERIDWQPYKTPTEYVYEVKPEAFRAPFRALTNSFLRVRYGHFEATEATFREMQTWQEEIKKGGSV